MDDAYKPRPYDLTKPDECKRLIRELRGYLHACQLSHHGTDFAGRRFAQQALDDIAAGKHDDFLQSLASSDT